ncbi:efflux RND transporter permease subunit, partial [Wenyingzhuangia sp. 1_MG-2023]|nr:efflux RND transporter permease subunit [Wenyingzhuangia sp. 1_MG-2023]
FLPDEDQGVLLNLVMLPAGATMERNHEVMDKLNEHYMNEPAVDSVFTVSGFSFTGRGQNQGLAFVKLKPWGERLSPDQSVGAVI